MEMLLIVEDDDNDRLLIREAIEVNQPNIKIQFARDGVELMNFLNKDSNDKDEVSSSKPRLILLDLNMPKMDGREALRILKSDPNLKRIPIVVFTTSIASEDISQSYDLCANSVIKKPDSFHALVEIMSVITKYWFQIVSPSEN